MKRYALALILSVVFGSFASAQLPSGFGPPPPIPHQPVLQGPVPTPGIPVSTAGRDGFYKSGGVLVGSNGYFPYDTGAYLLGGTDGLARSMGFYTMVPAVTMDSAPGTGTGAPCPYGPRVRHFRR